MEFASAPKGDIARSSATCTHEWSSLPLGARASSISGDCDRTGDRARNVWLKTVFVRDDLTPESRTRHIASDPSLRVLVTLQRRNQYLLDDQVLEALVGDRVISQLRTQSMATQESS